ncbi:MAG: DUF2189 domain-containing protein [Gemmatimonadaceae bacterium]|nr:DUF2189 domain-containing protein [Acetobacteraceae bacterium]
MSGAPIPLRPDDDLPVGSAIEPTSVTAELEAVGPAIRRDVPLSAIPRWLRAGWKDFRLAPLPSLAVGAVCTVVSWVLVGAMVATDYAALILPLTAGFMFAAPVLAVGLYEGSRRHAAHEAVTLDSTRAALRRNPTQIAFMGAILMLFLYGWLRVATLLFALFFGLDLPPLGRFLSTAFLSPDSIGFVLTGTGVGLVMAAIVFGLSAISLPMLVDRRVDAITAAITSMRACTANPITMGVWAATIVVLTLAAAAPGFLGFVVVLPLVGHATWHAYRDLVEPG